MGRPLSYASRLSNSSDICFVCGGIYSTRAVVLKKQQNKYCIRIFAIHCGIQDAPKMAHFIIISMQQIDAEGIL